MASFLDILKRAPAIYGDTITQGLAAGMDDEFYHATTGWFAQLDEILVNDIASASTEVLDYLAWQYNIYLWDRSLSAAVKLARLQAGLELVRSIGTPYAVKEAVELVLDPDNIDTTLHPIIITEGTGGAFYNGDYRYDGTLLYNSEFHWARFSVTIPYDGTPTAEEQASVLAAINAYKNVRSVLYEVFYIPLQTAFAHFKPGDADYGYIAHDSVLEITGDMTILASLYWEGFDVTPGYPALISKAPSVGGYPYAYILANGTTYGSFPAFKTHDGTTEYTVAATTALTTNAINRIGAIKSGLNVTHYVNGVDNTAALGAHGIASSQNILIMSNPRQTGDKAYGYVWDLAVYDSALPVLTVKNVTLGTADIPTGYVGYWRMNEETGLTCADQSANANDMTLTGVDWKELIQPWGDDTALVAKISNYFKCNESSSSILVVDSVGSAIGESNLTTATMHTTGALGSGFTVTKAQSPVISFPQGPTGIESASGDLFDLNKPFSFGFWYINSSPAGLEYNTLMQTGTGTTSCFRLIFLKTNKQPHISFYGPAGYVGRVNTGGFTPAFGQLHFVSVTYDGGGTIAGVKMYVDGTDYSSSSGALSANFAGGDLEVFSQDAAAAYPYPTLPYFDGLFFSDQELTPTEIAYLYNQGAGFKWALND